MNVTVDVRGATEVSNFLRAVYQDQLPFVNSSAINSTAKDFQADERRHMADIFTIRRKSFAERSVRIKPFATKDRQEAKIAIDSAPSGPSPSDDIFSKFEYQTFKTATDSGSVAVPTANVPRTAAGVIKKGWRPKDILAAAKPNVKRRKSHGAFVTRTPSGTGTIFMRSGGEVKALYQLVPRVRIRPELDFEVTARRTVGGRWVRNWTVAFDRAMRTAR